MFISKLTQRVEQYDPYGFYRLNGIKIVYVLLVMYGCNVFFDIKSPYFFYFYMPLTVISLEFVAETIKDKYTIFIHTMLQTLLLIMCLSIAIWFPLFFILFTFLSASSLYLMVFHKKYLSLTAVSTSLSLAAYSFNYINFNSNLFNLIISISDSLLASLIIIAACILFPRRYYYRLWSRALYLLMQDTLLQLTRYTSSDKTNKKSINYHMIKVNQFSKILRSKRYSYSVAKINLLAYRIHSLSCVTQEPRLIFTDEELQTLKQGIADFMQAIQKYQPCAIPKGPYPILHALIRSWNYLESGDV